MIFVNSVYDSDRRINRRSEGSVAFAAGMTRYRTVDTSGTWHHLYFEGYPSVRTLNAHR
jgi:hypothetical protein